MSTNDDTRIEHTVAANLNVIGEHRAELLAAGVEDFAVHANRDGGLVALDVGGHRTRTHMGEVAQDRVAHVVEVGHLHVVKNNDVLINSDVFLYDNVEKDVFV